MRTPSVDDVKDNLDWEVALKKNSSKRLRFNSGLPLKNSSEGPYGLGAVIVAVLFVGIALFIEKQNEIRSNVSALSSSSTQVEQRGSVSYQVKKIAEQTLGLHSSFREVRQTEKGLLISLGVDELFRMGLKASSETPLNIFQDEVEDTLKVFAKKILLQDNKISMEILAHTDQRLVSGQNKGGYATNWELAAAQASKVALVFNRAGILGRRITVISKGDTLPLLPAQDIRGDYIEKNLKQNRRLEILLYK